MNILLIISKNDRYGAQQAFLNQAAALHRMGHHLVVVGRGNTGYVPESVLALGIEYHGLPLKGIKDIVFLVRLIKKNNINIIHTYLDRADYVGIILSLITRKPVVSTMNVRRYHFGYKLVDRVVIVSNKQRELLHSKRVPVQKIYLVRPGIEFGRFSNPDADRREAWKKKLDTDRYSIVFCHISSMIPQKSHGVSIDLVGVCKQRGENPFLIIAGDPLHGEYYDTLIKKIREAGLDQNVYFTGWTTELPELL